MRRAEEEEGREEGGRGEVRAERCQHAQRAQGVRERGS